MRIGVTILNVKEGGRVARGGYDYAPAVEVIAADSAYTDLIVICEGKYYAHEGYGGLLGLVSVLAKATGRPLAGMLGVLDRGPFPPAIIYDTAKIRPERWYGHGAPDTPDDKRNWFLARTRDGGRFGVLPQHWDYQSGDRRLGEAQLISWIGGQHIPVLVAGDFNSTTSGPRHEPQRDFTKIRRPDKMFHKGLWAPQQTTIGPDTRALDYLLGWWDPDRGQRVMGVGLVDAAEVEYVRSGDPAVLLATSHDGDDKGGPLRIDRALVNEAGRTALVPGSFRVVDTQDTHPALDHNAIRVMLDIPGGETL